MENLPSSSSLPLRGEQQSSLSYQKYFFVKRENDSFAAVSPFPIHKTLQVLLGDIQTTRKLRSGDLLIEVSTAKQASIISQCKTFGPFTVNVIPHPTLNFSKGVISEPELLHVPDAEILENLKDQNVTEIRRITIRRDGKILPTKHIIITINSPSLPTHIKAGYLRCPVRPYVPNPLRCFNCQRFGHSKTSCRGTTTCARCSQTGHESESCNHEFKCLNCKNNHPAYSRSCPKWITEKEIQAIRVKNKISYPEARQTVLSRSPTVGVSYASVLQPKKTVSIGTQTDSCQSFLTQKTLTNPSSQKVGLKQSGSQTQNTSLKKHSSIPKSVAPGPSTSPQTSKPLKTAPPKKLNKPETRPVDPGKSPGLSKKHKKNYNYFKDPNAVKEIVEAELALFPSDISDDESMEVTTHCDHHPPNTALT